MNPLFLPYSENLDKVQSLVENIFQDIPNNNCNRANFPGQPCMSEHLQVCVLHHA